MQIQNQELSSASSFVRINLSITARLVTVNMSFQVNSAVLKTTRRGWHEIEIADELLTCVRTTLERDASSVLEITSIRDADIEWKFQAANNEQADGDAERQQAPQLGHERSSDQWVPLASAKSMKDAIHNSFQMLIENPKLNEGIE